MKKYLLIIALIILSMSVIISCDNTNKSPTTEEKPSTSEDDPTATTKSEIVVLDFSEVSNSRGLTKFPDTGNPFDTVEGGHKENLVNMIKGTTYGLWMSCNVMRSLPIFPGLKSANASADAYVNSIKNKDLKGYGFPIKVVKAEKTSDGVYIVYDILEGDKVNGRIEYYYSSVEKKFSYREIVAPLLGKLGAGDQIFVFEMFNVPVEKAQNGYSFKAGELYNNGLEFRHVSFISDTIGRKVQNLPLDEIDRFMVEDAKIVMNYNNNVVTSMEYEKYSSNKPNDGTLPGIFLNVLTDNIYEKINISEREERLLLDAQVDFLKTVFNERSFAFNGYNSLSEFNNSSLEYLAGKQNTLDEYTDYPDKKFNGIGFPLSYDLNKNIGSCLYNNNGTVNKKHFDQSANGAYSFPPFVLDQFKKCFGTSEAITSFNQFVSLMFKNLELPKYAEIESERQTLLHDTYN